MKLEKMYEEIEKMYHEGISKREILERFVPKFSLYEIELAYRRVELASNNELFKKLRSGCKDFQETLHYYNYLARANINTLRALESKSNREILAIRHIGKKRANKILSILGRDTLESDIEITLKALNSIKNTVNDKNIKEVINVAISSLQTSTEGVQI